MGVNKLFKVFLPFVFRPPERNVEPIYLDVPDFANLNLTNPQAYRDRTGVIFAATRADSAIGGVVWRVDSYQDKDHRGNITQVFATDPLKYFANGELVLWPDGMLYYVTVEIDDIKSRNILAQVIYQVPGWTP